MKESIERLQYICENFPGKLFEIEDQVFENKVNENWSKKEILGHLIDSATNNHHRFIRGQYEEIPKIVYDQNKWNELNNYQNLDKIQIIQFWLIYNQHILFIVKNINSKKLKNEVNTGSPEYFTLEYLIIDYVNHLEHHLKQIIEY